MACQACWALSTDRAREPHPFQGLHLLALRLPAPVGAMFLTGHKLPLGFLLARWLRLPHAHHPDLQGITSSVRALLGGSRCMHPQLSWTWAVRARRSCSASHIDAAVNLGRPGFGSVEQMIQFGLGLLLLTEDPSILGRSHQEEGAHLATALQKG